MPQARPLICRRSPPVFQALLPPHRAPHALLRRSRPPASPCALSSSAHLQCPATLTRLHLSLFSLLLKAAQYQAQKVIIKASLAAPDSAVRVVWCPKARVTPASPEHLCKRGTRAPSSTSLGILGKSLTHLEPKFHL